MRSPFIFVLVLAAIGLFASSYRASAQNDAGPTAVFDSSVYDASVQGPTSSGEKPAAIKNDISVSKDPIGFFGMLYKLASSKQYFWVFTIILMGLVEVTRAPWLLKKLPWIAGDIGAHVTAGLTALVLTLTAGGIANHALTAGVFGTAVIQAVLAALGWKGRSAGGAADPADPMPANTNLPLKPPVA